MHLQVERLASLIDPDLHPVIHRHLGLNTRLVDHLARLRRPTLRYKVLCVNHRSVSRRFSGQGGEPDGASLVLTANMLMRLNQSGLHARIVPLLALSGVF